MSVIRPRSLMPAALVATLFGTSRVVNVPSAYKSVATDAVRVVTDDLTPVVDTVRFRLGRTRHIQRSEVTVLVQEAVPLVCIVIVEPNNLTPVVDAKRLGVRGPREVYRGERAVLVDEAVQTVVVDECADNLATVADPGRGSQCGTGDVNCYDAIVFENKSVIDAVIVTSDDLSTVVDPVDNSQQRCGNIHIAELVKSHTCWLAHGCRLPRKRINASTERRLRIILFLFGGDQFHGTFRAAFARENAELARPNMF